MPNRTILLLVSALLALLASGCGTYMTIEGDLPAGNSTMAVMDFEPDCYTAMRDYVFTGRAGVHNPGPIAARLFRRVLALRSKRVRVLTWRGMEHRLMGQMPDASAPPADVAAFVKKVAEEMGVQYVIMGKLCKYHTAWFLVVQWVRVHFTVTCYDGETGKEVFSVEAEDKRYWAVEEDVMLDLSEQIVNRLTNPEQRRAK